MDISELLQTVINQHASDLHIIEGYYPSIRIVGNLHVLTSYPVLSKEQIESLIFSVLRPEQKENLLTNREIDVGYSFQKSRFRINCYYAQGSICASFRYIPDSIRTVEELQLPSSLLEFVDIKQGLVLVTGPTGAGKTSTLAAMVNKINLSSAKHIITIEDPVEYIYPKAKSIVSQRQLQDDTLSWNMALRSALREDPDVILVGEMRDHETIQLVLTAAETGHLVFSTLHTNSTVDTIDRIIDSFPSQQQNQVRNQLSTVLSVVVAQRLVPTIAKTGLMPSIEILRNSFPIAENIREGKTYLLNNILETSENEGCILFEKYLLGLYRSGKIAKDTALTYAIRSSEMAKLLK